MTRAASSRQGAAAAMLVLWTSTPGAALAAPVSPPAPGTERLSPPTGDTSELDRDAARPGAAPPPAPPVAPQQPAPSASPSSPAPSPSTPSAAPPPAPSRFEGLPEAEYPARQEQGAATGGELPELAQPEKVSPSARRHDGFFLRAGIGVTYAPVSRPTSRYGGKAGQSFEMLFGGTPWEGVVVGGGFLTTGIDSSFPLACYAAFVQYYPDPRKGLHLQGLGAFAILTDESPVAGGVVAAGAGYDYWIGDQTSLGAFVRAGYGAVSGTPNVPVTTTDGSSTVHVSSAFFTASFDFTWH